MRRARQAAGLSQEDLAAKISYSAAQVSAVERAARRPSGDLADRVDTVLGLDGRMSRLLGAIRHEGARPELRPWLIIEAEATAIRSFQLSVIPGLLQTEAYARVALTAGGVLPPAQVEEQATLRIERQAVLFRDEPPQAVFVIDEQVLRRPVGGPEVMREQLLHLARLSDGYPHIHIHVVPLSAGAYVGMDGPLAVATSPQGEVTCYLDGQLAGTLVESPTDVGAVLRRWEAVRGQALPIGQSRQLIGDVAEQWT
ncbi:Scr1 family TA system antitoxin-like transcriptional regulator [Micromonospora zhanjiangensis]